MVSSATPVKPLVLIDGREISKKRGIGHFCRELLYNINNQADSTCTKYICLIPDSTHQNIQRKYGNIDFITRKLFDAIVWEQLTLPIEALRCGATHVLCPYNTFPVLLSKKIKKIIVYHDLIFLHASRVGGGTKLFLGNKYRSFILKFYKKSDIILTVSYYTRDLLRRFCGIDSIVIGNSCNHTADMLSNAAFSLVHKEYFLHVGGDALTKNTKHIILSFLAARKSAGSVFPKLIVMGVSSRFAETLRNTLNFDEEVQFRFNISDEEKSFLIKGALAVVFVSTREGFGLPIIEAHAAGTRVITSRRRPMRDIAAESDLLVSPSDENELIAAYHEVLRRKDRCSVLHRDNKAMPDQFRIIEGLLR